MTKFFDGNTAINSEFLHKSQNFYNHIVRIKIALKLVHYALQIRSIINIMRYMSLTSSLARIFQRAIRSEMSNSMLINYTR